MNDAAELLRTATIRELGERVRTGAVSPVALAEAALRRLDTVGRLHNAVITLMDDAALDEAREAEAEIGSGHWRGPLHGIPYGAKDLLATRGAPTTWGAEPYREQVFEHDAAVITRLRDAGAVLVAKLAMVELAGGMGYNHADASFTGPGLCPWNRAFWSGGSSTGPGAAVAAGCLPFAIGSETSGSILTPAAFCGVTGLRPTYGLVSRFGAMALSWTLDKLGPMARSADDCGLVLAAIAGEDVRDESCAGRPFHWREPAMPERRLRIGVPAGCTEKVQPAVRENFDRALDALAANADVVRDLPWPDFPWGPAVGAIVAAEGAAAFLDLFESGRIAQLRCPADRTGGYSSLALPAVDYVQAMRVRRPMKRALADLFTRVDVIATPTRATVAYPADRRFDEAYPGVSGGPAVIPAGNLAGLPALCAPCGFGENGLPTSIAFMGAPWSERTLLALGHVLQMRSDWHRRQPPES